MEHLRIPNCYTVYRWLAFRRKWILHKLSGISDIIPDAFVN
ncbi:hypothetical protein EG68_07811 [Paragonimus skrjabini miyazakii]|uniref:Uncharacterized protein n=1 Tax=Paragonimus skrjabini miyazakii TaxID=59628 RepID=A0A8S9YBE1_9TREM|nr:hypothetical protein EG68_07811 [Paragonimus skrjabini miyazakii]